MLGLRSLASIGIVSFAISSNFALAVDAFTIVALPDSQNYMTTAEGSELFVQQTQWIADEVLLQGNPRNIQFVSHLGDVVANGRNLEQWERADAAMDILDGVVKYSVLPGNHDFAERSIKDSGVENYLAFFGPQRFVNNAWFGGADPSGLNTFQRFSAGGYDFIHLALEFQPTENIPFRDPSPVQWAQSVLDANPETPVILSTHDYLQDSPLGRSAAGEAVWNELVRTNDQIFMVLNGHFHHEIGEYHRISTNDAGRSVIEVIQNYQSYENGGNGWLRLIEFNIPENRIEFQTFSPVLSLFQTEGVEDVGPYASHFGFDVNFAERLDPLAAPPLTPGDFDDNGSVNGRDFLVWQRGGSTDSLSESDLTEWQLSYGSPQILAVPEPTSAMLYFVITVVLCRCDRIGRCR